MSCREAARGTDCSNCCKMAPITIIRGYMCVSKHKGKLSPVAMATAGLGSGFPTAQQRKVEKPEAALPGIKANDGNAPLAAVWQNLM